MLATSSRVGVGAEIARQARATKVVNKSPAWRHRHPARPDYLLSTSIIYHFFPATPRERTPSPPSRFGGDFESGKTCFGSHWQPRKSVRLINVPPHTFVSFIICQERGDTEGRWQVKKKVSLRHFALRYQRLMEVGGKGWRNLWKSLKFVFPPLPNSFNDFSVLVAVEAATASFRMTSVNSRRLTHSDSCWSFNNSMSRHCSLAKQLGHWVGDSRAVANTIADDSSVHWAVSLSLRSFWEIL